MGIGPGVHKPFDEWPDVLLSSSEAQQVLNNIVKIYAGEASSFAIDKNDTLWAWGSFYGYMPGSYLLFLEPKEYLQDIKCVASQYECNLVLKKDNTLWLYGNSEKPDTLSKGFGHYLEMPIKIMDDVNSVSGGNGNSNSALILKNNGELFQFELTQHTSEDDNINDYVIDKVMDNVRLVETKQKKYRDISGVSKEIQNAVNALSNAGIISGTSENEFSPDKPITRAEVAALLLRMTAKPEEQGNGGFADVPEGAWYYGVAGASKKYGIISG